jgi:hypothetical protein
MSVGEFDRDVEAAAVAMEPTDPTHPDLPTIDLSEGILLLNIRLT